MPQITTYSTVAPATGDKLVATDVSNSDATVNVTAGAVANLMTDAANLTTGTLDIARIANDAVTYAKIQNVSATDRLLGRSTTGAGDIEEITCTAFARSLLDDANASTARATLGANDASNITTGTLAPAYGGAIDRGRLVVSGTNYYIVPGAFINGNNTRACIANTVFYEPWLVTNAITLDQLSLEVTTLAGGSTIKVAIYAADATNAPTSLTLDAGSVSGATTGQKTISISQTLQPGRYLLAVVSDGTPTLRSLRCPWVAIRDTLTANPVITSFTASGITFANFPATISAPSATTAAAVAFDFTVVARAT